MKQKQNKEPAESREQIEYREAQIKFMESQKDFKDAELRMILRSRGIDTYNLSQKDIDDIRRHINKMQQIDALTKSKMKSIEQEGNKEQAVISQEIELIIARVCQEQNPVPPLPEMQQELTGQGVPGEEQGEHGV